MKLYLLVISVLFGSLSFASDVEWSSRLEGTDIANGLLSIEDGDFNELGPDISDAFSLGFVRLGFEERAAMNFLIGNGINSDVTIQVVVRITPYDIGGSMGISFPKTLEIVYSADGGTGVTVDGADVRMPGVHKFDVEVESISVKDSDLTNLNVPDFLYLEAGFYAERYYKLDDSHSPLINAQFIKYEDNGSMTEVLNSSSFSEVEEIFLNWEYVEGAEYYDLEWTWVDNYPEDISTSPISPGNLAFTDADFKRNSTRIRTSDQSYKIPQIFSKGFLMYRVRGVGRWLDETDKDFYGLWSKALISKTVVANWDFVEILAEHEGDKNWQYQTTYAEDGKKKEVTQYFDGSLRGRQTVTRINSDNHSVVGETIYDNEGRGVIQILPVPQANPGIRYYENLNISNNSNEPYSHLDFDWEQANDYCDVVLAGPLSESQGAAQYYSTTGVSSSNDWQQYVPDAKQYPFTQVEYTPDNTGRIRNQSGVGADHKIGSGHETYYYYMQPSQEELNRLFGYKVGYMSRYKKNMVVDANGQVSVSYLDAQGRVVATAMAGDNPVDDGDVVLKGLDSEESNFHNEMYTNLLNKDSQTDVDDLNDNNDLISTGTFGSNFDGLDFNTQLGVTGSTNYDFFYDIKTGKFKNPCDETIEYPFVYEVRLTLTNDCGEDIFSQAIEGLDQNYSYTSNELISTIDYNGTNDYVTVGEIPSDLELGSATLDGFYKAAFSIQGLPKGTYTLNKTVIINKEALEIYKEHYLHSTSSCVLDHDDFESPIESDCLTSCEECKESLDNALTELAIELGNLQVGQTIEDFTMSERTTFINLHQPNYDNYVEECLEPCELNTSCDSYRQMMLADLHPGGQYGSVAIDDQLSVFNATIDYSQLPNSLTTGSGLRGYWKDATGFVDENGNPAQVLAYPSAANSLEYDFIGNGIDPAQLVSPNQLSRESFINGFESSWAEALLPFHPEYPLLEYAEVICNQEVPSVYIDGALTSLSSGGFDAMLHHDINTLTQASALANSPMTLNADFLMTIDPYFIQSYTSIHSPTLALVKNQLMDNALNIEYKGTGFNLLGYSVKVAIYNSNPSFDALLTNLTDWDLSSAPLNLTSGQIDLVWQTYKSFYLSYKGLIDQSLMDLHGFNNSPSIHNAFIGNGSTLASVNNTFSLDPTPLTTLAPLNLSVFNAWNSNFPFPTINANNVELPLHLDLYNEKEIRVVRVDNLYDSSLPEDVVVEELAAEADYGMWSSSGACPLTLDVQFLLNSLGTSGNLSTAMSPLSSFNGIGLTSDLCDAINGSTLDNEMEIPMSISGTDLVLNFPTNGPVSCDLTIPQLSSDFTWTDYSNGQWSILGVSNSFATTTGVKVLFTILDNSTQEVEEFVVEYTMPCIDFNACQNDYIATGAQDFDPDCEKEEKFEGALLTLIQGLMASNQLNSSVSLDGIEAYDNILSNYLPAPATWNANNATITFSGGVFNLGFSLPNSAMILTSLNIVGDQIYYSYFDDVSQMTVSSQSSYNFIGDGLFLDFSCPCVDFENMNISELELAYTEFMNYLVNNYNSGNIPIPIGTEVITLTPNFSNVYNSSLWNIIGSSDGIGTIVFGIKNDVNGISISQNTIHCPGYDVGDIQGILSTNFSTNSQVLNFSENDGSVFNLSGTNQIVLDVGQSAFMTGTMSILMNDQSTCISLLGEPGLFYIIDEPCLDCPPIPVEPIACNAAYEQYVSYMESYLGFSSMTSEEQDIFNGDFLVSEESFCNSQYAYISEAYDLYLSALSVDDVAHPDFITIGAFGATHLGFSDQELTAAVNAYNSWLVDNDQTTDSYLPWNQYVETIYFPTLGAYCPPNIPYTSIDIVPETASPCLQEENTSIVNANNQYDIYEEQLGDAFEQAYIEEALANVVENFAELHTDKEYHYTLYYYDRAGNLIQTVPPKGVDRFEFNYDANTGTSYGIPNGNNNISGSHNQINEQRSLTGVITDNSNLAPEHTFETEYRYNSLNQLVYQNTPDGGESRFAYDALGRLVLSQNAKQKVNNQYSYTKYDELGRVIEVGELTLTHNALQYINGDGRYVTSIPDVNGFISLDPWSGVNHSSFPNNMSEQREEITFTIYDEFAGRTTPINSGSGGALNIVQTPIHSLFSNYSFDNTRNRIVGVLYIEDYDALDPNFTSFENATFYNYDVHGNVDELIQVNNHSGLMKLNQHIKHFNYEYDLVSGNVNKVIYQKGAKDQFIHRYCYDSDNRITIAETSKDGVVYEKDAKYFYYDHGPLARTEIGEQKVQASDYAYTIQGWLKSVNGEQISEQTMMGQDGKVNTVNALGAMDAHGFSLKYFDGDYSSSNTSMLDYSLPNSSANLFNGNIRSMFTSLSDQNEASLGTHQTNYTYDQLNRIKSMDGVDNSTGSASNYSSSYVFDPNGNLDILERTIPGSGPSPEFMDRFKYNYTDGTNQLTDVQDAITGNFIQGYGDIQPGQNNESHPDGPNYQYDEIGQLILDRQENIDDIKWKVTNKVEEIVKSDGKVIRFEYDAMGNRIAKHVIHLNNDINSTFYILDAQGNPMSIYKYNHYDVVPVGVDNDQLHLAERNIYGSSRVGAEYPNLDMGYVEILDIQEVDFAALNYMTDNTVYCSTGGNIGVWEYGVPTPYVYNYSITANNDLAVDNTPTTSTGANNAPLNPSGNLLYTSVQLMINTVPGEDYTVNFDLEAPFDHTTTDAYALSCAGNGILGSSSMNAAGSSTFTFTANTDVTRIKFLNRDDNGLSTVTFGDMSFVGEGNILGTDVTTASTYYVAENEIGDKRYELSNHLGNVLEVVTDRKLPIQGVGSAGSIPVDHYVADVVAYSDYYPYGMLMPGRHFSDNDGYRYGYQGQETDDEVKGKGNSVNYKYRMHDARIGRFFAVDPLAKLYSFQSPYTFSENVVIHDTELEGLERTGREMRRAVHANPTTGRTVNTVVGHTHFMGVRFNSLNTGRPSNVNSELIPNRFEVQQSFGENFAQATKNYGTVKAMLQRQYESVVAGMSGELEITTDVYFDASREGQKNWVFSDPNDKALLDDAEEKYQKAFTAVSSDILKKQGFNKVDDSCVPCVEREVDPETIPSNEDINKANKVAELILGPSPYKRLENEIKDNPTTFKTRKIIKEVQMKAY